MSDQDTKDLINGRFNDVETIHIINAYTVFKKTANTISKELHRDIKSVQNKITKLQKDGKIPKAGKAGKSQKNSNVGLSYIGSLNDEERKAHFNREIMNSARYKALQKSFTPEELEIYREKYVDFMMDPTVETMTTMEKDMLHQWFISEIRVNRFMQEEKESHDAHVKDPNKPIISRSREIKECQEIIAKCQRSLNVEREQRLKNQSDQAITFTNLIREMKHPSIRAKAGKEAAMFRYIEQKFYNDKLGTNIISGKDMKFDIGANFKSGKDPNLGSDFTPTIADIEKEENGIERFENEGGGLSK